MRWVRLVMGLFIAFQAFEMQSVLMAFLSAIVLFQALTNTGCCGASGCSVDVPKIKKDQVEDVKFEEIKPY